MTVNIYMYLYLFYLDLLPKIKEAKQTVDLFNRVTMSFDVVLEKGNEQVGM
jgi:hypothetical protein